MNEEDHSSLLAQEGVGTQGQEEEGSCTVVDLVEFHSRVDDQGEEHYIQKNQEHRASRDLQ